MIERRLELARIVHEVVEDGRRHMREMTRITEREMHAVVLACTRTRPSGNMLDRAMPSDEVIRRLGFDATAHGCRSSFADWSREVAKADREVRELALAHRETNKAVSAYSRSDLLEAQKPVMQAWSDYLTPS